MEKPGPVASIFLNLGWICVTYNSAHRKITANDLAVLEPLSSLSTPRQEELAELGADNGTSEEALVSDNPRNASVVMKADGCPQRMAKPYFDELVRDPFVNWIDLKTAKDLVTPGNAQWLEARTIAEFRHARVTDAIFCPLQGLRRQPERLDKNSRYVCCHKTGKRNSAATFSLNDRGFKVLALEGGLQALPDSEYAGCIQW